MAVNCCVSPAAIVTFAGVTATLTKLGAVTVKAAVPLTDPTAAVMLLLPAILPVAAPLAVTVAVVPFADVQLAMLVTSCVVPSE